ncbi:transcription factor domain-containing protein [Aspergillus undulatus]|uniref:transcription factor domain-containing protein n=1 Tax=Aspergillus undulatus TaxID=1810928 RepID=UPI003CCCAB1C
MPCHSRKIKCDGSIPCRSCVAKGRACHRRIVQPGSNVLASEPVEPIGPSGTLNPDTTESGSSQDKLLRRIDLLESQLQRLIHSTQPDASQTPSNSKPAARTPSREPQNIHSNTPPDDTSPFVGETSMAHTLKEVENRFQKIRDTYGTDSPSSPSKTLRPLLNPAIDEDLSDQPDQVRSAFKAHGIIADRAKWDQDLQAFIDEMHVLYPILHLPTLREEHARFWNNALDEQGACRTGDSQALTMQLLICLAIGRCTRASRAGPDEVQHSSGWSLYSAAMDLLGAEAGVFTLRGNPLPHLQTLALMVVYLLRLDANDRASKVIAMVISHAHQLGLHRDRMLSQMPVFDREMYRRLWWCIYILDRQVSLETGLPFVIQDFNVDTGFPLELSDDWLSRYRDNHETAGALKTKIDTEISARPVTPIPYLVCMIRYSKVIGKVWEALYKAREGHLADKSSDALTQEYLEHLISSAERQTPRDLVYNREKPLVEQIAGLDRWQIKQKALMCMRWTFLRLCIRRPMLNHASSSEFTFGIDGVENESKCIKLAKGIFDQFYTMYSQYPSFEFPFPHYLTRTTMISLGLIIKESSFRQVYGDQTLQMSRDIKRLCQRTWISGKFARSVVTLNKMAESVLVRPTASTPQRNMQNSSSIINLELMPPSNPNGALYGDNAAILDRTFQSHLEHADLSAKNGAAITSGHQNSALIGGVDPEISQTQAEERNGAADFGSQVDLLTPLAPAPYASLMPSSSTIDHQVNQPGHPLLPSHLDLVTRDFEFERTFAGDNTHRDTYFSHLSASPNLHLYPTFQQGSSAHNTSRQSTEAHIDLNPTDSGVQAEDLQLDLQAASMDWVQELLGAGFHADSFILW